MVVQRSTLTIFLKGFGKKSEVCRVFAWIYRVAVVIDCTSQTVELTRSSMKSFAGGTFEQKSFAFIYTLSKYVFFSNVCYIKIGLAVTCCQSCKCRLEIESNMELGFRTVMP